MPAVFLQNIWNPVLRKMILVAVLAACICVTASVASSPSCVVGPWGEWGRCQSLKSCSTPPESKSRAVSNDIKAMHLGRLVMQHTMEEKEANYERTQACLENRTCPENAPQQSIRRAQPCVDGMSGIFPCQNVDLLAFLNFTDLGYDGPRLIGNDLWVWHDTQSDPVQHYVIMGLSYGTSFVRVTDPENPEVLGTLDTHTTSNLWRDMKVVDDYAFIVSEARGHGMQVFDLSQLRGLAPDTNRKFSVSAHYSNVSNAHNIVANAATKTVFIVGARSSSNLERKSKCLEGGLHMVDVSDPLNPTFSGCFDDDGYSHDAQCLIYQGPDTRYNGREICYCFNEDSFTIVDVTDRKNGQMLSRVKYNGMKYTHQGWATEDNHYLYMDDEQDEVYSDAWTKTYVWDISNLTNPVNHYTHLSTETAIDHNLYIDGDIIHQSNYMAGYRLLQIDFTRRGVPQEVGYFDVYPSATKPRFQGTWSNYPWLSDSKGKFTAVSSIDYGLFILRPDMTAIRGPQNIASGHMMRYRQALYGDEHPDCPALVESKPCTPDEC